MPKKSCFVVMGFGEKTDFQSNPQRVLNLNKTYEYIIKPAVEEADLECIRADQIIHSTVIDKPMYERLLNADLVIADLSTSNANAIYELGVRHALRPCTTIVMAETSFSFPFDLSHLSILKYEHLGKEIGYGEVLRVKSLLKTKISELIDKEEADSPVFVFLPDLEGAKISTAAAADLTPGQKSKSSPELMPKVDDKSFAELLESFRAAKAGVKRPVDWIKAIAFLERLRTMQPKDPYVIQQLALATYKSEQPDKLTSLRDAQQILEELLPRKSSDAETVGLWGAIHKRLWEQSQDRNDLDEAIRAYERGFYIKNDYYNGINYAFLLDTRATLTMGEEAVADRVLARRIRASVLAICDELLASGSFIADDKFWIEATKVEAIFGLGRRAEAEKFKSEILAREHELWKESTMTDQLSKLERLL